MLDASFLRQLIEKSLDMREAKPAGALRSLDPTKDLERFVRVKQKEIAPEADVYPMTELSIQAKEIVMLLCKALSITVDH